MRLINADAIKYAIEKRIDAINDADFAEGLAEAMIEIDHQPTVDAIPVIRCKDCKFAPKCYGDIARASKDGGVVHSPLGTNGYCSLAERKEE